MLFEIQKYDIMTDKKKKEESVSTDEMVRSLANIIKNGMKLGRMTEKEQSDFQANLIDHISNSPYYTAFYDYDTKTIMVETSYFDPLICIDVTHDSIYFLPLTQKGYYQAFIKVIEFIMLDRKHKKATEKEEQQEEEKKEKVIPNFDFL